MSKMAALIYLIRHPNGPVPEHLAEQAAELRSRPDFDDDPIERRIAEVANPERVTKPCNWRSER